MRTAPDRPLGASRPTSCHSPASPARTTVASVATKGRAEPLRHLLHAGGHVHHVAQHCELQPLPGAEHPAERLAGVKADADPHGRVEAALGIPARDEPDDLPGAQDGAPGIIRLRLRDADDDSASGGSRCLAALRSRRKRRELSLHWPRRPTHFMLIPCLARSSLKTTASASMIFFSGFALQYTMTSCSTTLPRFRST
jgi:hypothetical protein